MMEANDQSNAGEEAEELEGGFSEALGAESNVVKQPKPPATNVGCNFAAGCGVKKLQ